MKPTSLLGLEPAKTGELHGVQQNTTRDKREVRELQPSQTRALAALAGGATVTSAAEAADVDRTTVHRWLRADFGFQAAYNGLRLDLRREFSAQLDSLAQVALETVCAAIESGDVRTSLAVLRGTGIFPGAAELIGSSNETELREDAKTEAQARAMNRLYRQLGSG